MLRVFKFDVPKSHGPFTIDLPEGSQILSAKVQDGYPQIWVLVDPSNRWETRHFFMAETGKWFDGPASELEFIDTFLLKDDSYIIHLFERKEKA